MTNKEVVDKINEYKALVKLLIEKEIIKKEELEDKLDEIRIENMSVEDREKYMSKRKHK